ncbi:MAG: CAP domain-containing protein [Deinococcota bacterium]
MNLVHAQQPLRYSPLGGDPAFERALLEATNTARRNNGAGRLEADDRLALAARHHAAEMAELGYISHESPNPQTALLPQRVVAAGSATQVVGENIATLSPVDRLDADLANSLVAGWLDSPRHRENLLRTDYTHVGFGAATSGGTVYAVQVFAYQPLELTAGDVRSSTRSSYEVEVVLELTSSQEVQLAYGRNGFPPESLGAGQHRLAFTTSAEGSDRLQLQVGVRAPTTDAFILQDEGWLDLRAGRFQPGQTPPRDVARLASVTRQVSETTYYDVTLQFAESVSAVADTARVWLGSSSTSGNQPLQDARWQGRTVTVSVPSNHPNPVLDVSVPVGGRQQVILSVALDFSAGRGQLVPFSYVGR